MSSLSTTSRHRSLWLAFGLPLIVLSSVSAQVGTKSQVFQTADFTITVPDGWEQQEEKATVLTLAAPQPPAGKFRENIRIKKYPLKDSSGLDAILATQIRTVPDQFTTNGSGILRQDEPRMAWMAITKRKLDPGEVPLTKTDYMLIHDGNLFVIHAMCEASQFDARKPFFDDVARSLTLKSPPPNQTPAVTPPAATERSEAYKQGGKVGQYTFYAMVVAVIGWLLFRFLGMLWKRKET